MPLDPSLQPLVDQFDQLSRMQRDEQSLEACRQQANQGLSVLFSEYAQSVPEVHKEFDLSISGTEGEIPLRVYLPQGQVKKIPVHVYLHGGSWWIGDRYFGDLACRSIVHQLGTAAISLGYRLAPEHKFPAALQDSYRLLEWIYRYGHEYGFDRERISIGGTSAGANIVAATSLMIKQSGGPRLCGQILECPALDATMACESIEKFADGYLLSKRALAEGWSFYLQDGDRYNPLASPLLADNFEGLPPTQVFTAEYDPLRDEGELYAERLRAAGVDVSIRRFDGMVHGFAAFTALLPQARECQQLVFNALRTWYGEDEGGGCGCEMGC
jgi:acetyl esterase